MSNRSNNILRQALLLGIMLCCFIGAKASVIKGVVRDSVSHEPVPFASVMIKSQGWGKLTDDHGKFSIDIPYRQDTDTLEVTAMGFAPKKVPFDASKSKLTIDIVSQGVALGEVIVRPRKEKYSK